MKVRGGKGRFRWWAGGEYSRRVADEAPLCLPAGRPLASSWKPRPAVTTRRRSSVHQYTPMWLLAPRADYCSRMYTGTGKWPAPAYTSAGHRPLLSPPVGSPTRRGARVYQLARHWTTHGCRPFMHCQCLGFSISRCKNLHWSNANQTPSTLCFAMVGCDTETRSGVYVLPVY